VILPQLPRLAASFNPLSNRRFPANSISTIRRFEVPDQRFGRSSRTTHSRTALASSRIEAGWRVQADLGAQHPAGRGAPLVHHVPPDEGRHHRPIKSCREKRQSVAEADQVPASTSFGRAGSFHAIRTLTKITPVTRVLSGSPNIPRLATKSPTAVPAALTVATVSQ
jgi:hypothetical protein